MLSKVKPFKKIRKMAKVKYRIREFKPTANQTGGHSVYAEAVVDNIITNKELARKVESRTD